MKNSIKKTRIKASIISTILAGFLPLIMMSKVIQINQDLNDLRLGIYEGTRSYEFLEEQMVFLTYASAVSILVFICIYGIGACTRKDYNQAI